DRLVIGSCHLMEDPSMTEDDVRAAAERLVDFHERFAPLFGKEQAQGHAYTYVKGLMVCPERKSIEPIALHVGKGRQLPGRGLPGGGRPGGRRLVGSSDLPPRVVVRGYPGWAPTARQGPHPRVDRLCDQAPD